MKGKKVWTLRSSYKDGDPESCGVFDSPRAMAIGLARCVHGDHQESSVDDLVDVVALKVFDMFYRMVPEEKFVSDECRDGYTAYGYEVDDVQSFGKNKEEEDART